MKPKLISIAGALTILSLSTQAAYGADEYINRTGTKLRTAMSEDSPSPCWFNANTKLKIEPTSEPDWLKTKACKTVGYIRASEVSPRKVKEEKRFMYATKTISIADTKGKIVGTIKQNTKLEVIEPRDSDRAMVRNGKTVAIVKLEDLSLSKVSQAEQSSVWSEILIAIAQGLAASQRRQTTASPDNTELLLFGGPKREYLGCLNCSEFSTESILNKFGRGNPFTPESIWNRYGNFGSRYSNDSACNPYANDPPVIVDRSGNYYGRLTLNKYHPQLGIGGRLMAWLGAVCN